MFRPLAQSGGAPQEQFGVSTSVLTLIFAVYAFTLLGSLLAITVVQALTLSVLPETASRRTGVLASLRPPFMSPLRREAP